jgi:hypothetical protein
MAIEEKAKVLIRSQSFDGEEDSAETVWTDRLSPDTYRIQNIPFFAYGVSLHDIVSAPIDLDSGFAIFGRVIAKSGNRTMRLILRKPIQADARTRRRLQELVGLGCDYSMLNATYAALNVPPTLNAARVEGLVSRISNQWERADPPIED